MKKILFYGILLSSVLIFFQAAMLSCEEKTAKYKDITSAELNERLSKDSSLFILDVRTDAEYNEEHITGVKKLIPVDQLENRIGEIENQKGRDIVVYCKSGKRSTMASELLSSKGFNNIYNLTGGILDYKGKGYKTEKGESAKP